MPPALTFNTAVSFVTGTNWQAYAGESTMSHLSQMSGLVVAQFTAAAVGMSVALAVVRGILQFRRRACRRAFTRTCSGTSGSMSCAASCECCCRSPLLATLVMVSQGAMQNLHGNTAATTVEGGHPGDPRWAGGHPGSTQDTRDERRRLLQRRIRTSARPTRTGVTNAFELFLVAGDPVRPAVHVRTARRPATSGLHDRGRDGRAVARADRGRERSPKATAIATTRRLRSRPRHSSDRARRAATWKARRFASGRTDPCCRRSARWAPRQGSPPAELDSYTAGGGAWHSDRSCSVRSARAGSARGLYANARLRDGRRVHRWADGRTHAGATWARSSRPPRSSSSPCTCSSFPIVVLAGTAATVLMLVRRRRSALEPGQPRVHRDVLRLSHRRRTATVRHSPGSTRTPIGTTRHSVWRCSEVASCRSLSCWHWLDHSATNSSTHRRRRRCRRPDRHSPAC